MEEIEIDVVEAVEGKERRRGVDRRGARQSVLLPAEVLSEVQELAQKETRSISAQILVLVKEALEVRGSAGV